MSKNVLFIHHVSFMGGAERYLLSLIEALPHDYKVFFICQEAGPLSQALENRGAVVQYMPLRAWRKFRFLFKNLLTLCTIIRFCKIHQIHLICSNNYRVSSYCIWPARFLKIPAITIVQDFVDRLKLKRFNALCSDSLITVSDSITKSVRPHFSGQITRIYNGLDIDVFVSSVKSYDLLRKEFPVLEGKRVIGMIAQIVPVKGHKVFLKSMAQVAKDFNDVMFVIVGASPNDQQLSLQDIKNYAQKLGIADRIICTGSRNDVASLLRSFDILVHPAFKEPFGRVVMEAMALAVPVVATASGGPGEIIENNKSGLLVPVGDDVQMAEAVKSLLRDEEKRKNISLEGRKRSEQFSLENTVSAIGPLLDKIILGD